MMEDKKLAELKGHPLLDEVKKVAREKGLDLSAYDSLGAIVNQISDVRVDGKTVLVIADLVERLIRFDQALSAADGGSQDQGPESQSTDIIL